MHYCTTLVDKVWLYRYRCFENYQPGLAIFANMARFVQSRFCRGKKTVYREVKSPVLLVTFTPPVLFVSPERHDSISVVRFFGEIGL